MSTNPNGMQFSINYIQRRRQMSLQYSQAYCHEVAHRFDSFISLLPSQVTNYSTIQKYPPKSKDKRTLTPESAREILHSLLQKSKLLGQRKNWKIEETNYLLFVIDKYCILHKCKCEQLGLVDWNYICLLIPYRDSSACQFRYLSLFPKPLCNVPWSAYERQLLHRIIQNQNSNSLNWKLISQKFYEQNQLKIFRTGKQCREHYTCFLQPNLKKGAWTEKEDYILVNLFLKIGKKWSKMAKFIEGRNQNSIKNRFFLMFENKKTLKLSHTDLVKQAKRCKDKIQKKIGLSSLNICFEEQNFGISFNSSDSSNIVLHEQNERMEQTPRTRSQSQLALTEHQHNQPVIKIQHPPLFAHQQFQQYISF